VPAQTVTAVDGATISSEQFFGRASALRYSGAQAYDAYLVNKTDKAITDLTLKFSGNFDASTTYKITLGTTSIEDVKAANPHGRNWFQLYVMRQREISYGLVERAAAAGFDTLMFTVDTPVAGARLRDKRNGFSIPPQITAGTVLNAIPRPWWWFDFLTTPKLEFASLKSTGGTVGELLDNAMDPTISDEDLKVIRSMWPGKIVIKGVQTVEDSKRLIDLGVDGVLLSNHGGRQLDRAPVPFRLLPEVVREVGKDATIMVDTGIMNGADVVAAPIGDHPAVAELVAHRYREQIA